MELDSVQGSTRRITGNILIFLPGIALGVSALVKFARVPGVVNEMAASGFADGKLALVAALELVSAVLLLYPRSRALGLLVFSSFMGGAICTHVQLGDYGKAVGPVILLCLAWTGIWLRHPQAYWSSDMRAVGNQVDVTKRESWV